MGIIVQVATAKPDFFICSWRSCGHKRDRECGKVGRAKIDETKGQCFTRKFRAARGDGAMMETILPQVNPLAYRCATREATLP